MGEPVDGELCRSQSRFHRLALEMGPAATHVTIDCGQYVDPEGIPLVAVRQSSGIKC